MAIITTDRSALDAVLADDTATVLLLVGSPASRAGRIHDCAAGRHAGCGPGVRDDRWRHVFLVTDPRMLTSAERREWFGVGPPWPEEADDVVRRYAVLDRTSERVCNGDLDALAVNGAHALVKIRQAFSRCEGGEDRRSAAL